MLAVNVYKEDLMRKYKSAKAYRRTMDVLGKSYYISKCTGATFRKRGNRKVYFKKNPAHARHKYKYVKTRLQTPNGYVIYRSRCSGSYHVRVFNARKKKYIRRYISKRYVARLRNRHVKRAKRKSHSRSHGLSALPRGSYYSVPIRRHRPVHRPALPLPYINQELAPMHLSPVVMLPPKRKHVSPKVTAAPRRSERVRKPNPKYV